MPVPDEVLAGRFARQADACSALGSPFYEQLLRAASMELEVDSPLRELLVGFEDEPGDALVALRLMGAVHRLILLGELPGLARHYPSTGGDGDAKATWPLFRRALAERRDEIRGLLTRGCQTNEVGRCAALLGGFLEVAHRTGLPLRTLEIGASAGLNARWDHYRYESVAGAWGDQGSAVRFVNAFEVAPPLDRAAEVVERKACDLRPIDPTTEEGALTLRSFIWADQLGRLALLDGAIDVAAYVPLEVEKLDAASFVERELASATSGVATVVYHSVVWQYVDEPGKRRILSSIAKARANAAPGAPVHHLEMEPAGGAFEVRLDGEVLGATRAHGTGVRWLLS